MATESLDERRTLIDALERHRKRYLRGQRWWSLCNWAPLYGTPAAAFGATISAAARWHHVVTVVLAAIATLLGAVGAVGRFGARWRINRLSRSEIDVLLVEARTNPTADFRELRERLESIIDDEDEAITGPPDDFEESPPTNHAVRDTTSGHLPQPPDLP